MRAGTIKKSPEEGGEADDDLTFAKKRTQTQIERDRAKRQGKAARKAGQQEAESTLQAIYIFIDEPDSSIAARAFSVIVVLAIMISSVLFVAETHSVVRPPAVWHLSSFAFSPSWPLSLCSSRTTRAAGQCFVTRCRCRRIQSNARRSRAALTRTRHVVRLRWAPAVAPACTRTALHALRPPGAHTVPLRVAPHLWPARVATAGASTCRH